MRWGVGAIILLLLAAVAYTAWPLINLYQVAAAVRSSDTVAFLQRVDLPAVRKSIARQILDRASEGKITGVKMSVDPAGREIAANLLEAKLEDVITPEMLFDILRRGRASGGAGRRPLGPRKRALCLCSTVKPPVAAQKPELPDTEHLSGLVGRGKRAKRLADTDPYSETSNVEALGCQTAGYSV